MKKVLCNGFPKSGNHALSKACQLLGMVAQDNHIPYEARDPSIPQILIKRDPRNIVCSYIRSIGKPVTPGMFISHFRHFLSKPLVNGMADYEPYLSDPDALIVSYEALIRDDQEMRRIAAFVGTPYLEGAFEELPGMTITYFPEHSDYKKIWTPEVESVWSSEGGPELLKRWGY